MVTPRKISRLVAGRQHEALMQAVLDNGRPLPIHARLRLAEPDALAAAGLSLGLQRLIELSGYACAESAAAATELLTRQESNGAFGSIAATAATIRALHLLLHAPGVDAGLQDAAAAALDRCVHALHCAIERDRLRGGPGLPGDELDAALVLWQLRDVEPARKSLDLNSLEGALLARIKPGEPAEQVLRAAGASVPERVAA